MDGDACDVFLRIRHPTLDPAEITAELGLTPEHHWQAGEIRRAEDGTPTQSRYSESYWVASVEVSRFPSGPAAAGLEPDPSLRVLDTAPMLEQRLALAAALLKSRKALWDSIKTGGRAELLVTLYSRGEANIELSSELMSLLDGIGLSISVEVHGRVAAA